jgi:cysteine desulfuration protein SufE
MNGALVAFPRSQRIIAGLCGLAKRPPLYLEDVINVTSRRFPSTLRLRHPIYPAMATICAAAPGTMSIDEIIENFALLEEWDDRYRYLIELGRELPPLPEAARNPQNKVQGCASQVWLATSVQPEGAGGPTLSFQGDSDAHIVRGLIAVLFALFSGKSAREILSTDAIALFERLGLRDHLTPQRSNGFRSMVERIRRDAQAALAPAA